MKILGIDTSTKFLALALSVNKKTVFRYRQNLGTRHSVRLLAELNRLLKQNGIKPSDIDLFCVGLGPGSFTGLRISLSTIKAFALGLKKDVLGVSSLDAIAKNVNQQGSISVVLDARRGNVYTADYENKNSKLKMISSPRLSCVNDWLNAVSEKIFVLGDALGAYADIVSKNKNIIALGERLWYPDAVNIISLGYERFLKYGADDIVKLHPTYLYSKECQIRKR
ncbi:MAG TPA: tRNA (adenosine(37)-N6)-threonylcarbamoyltransferase complex dimerization subunit type 1 TsaB [Candidatus Omnitrophica bacterium]|nr:tRNA (adenosine(37)-N6)-threonylcarbamoyltransferase complex dimerization subunit type 1 TsaB [Candidatus Omnitrophota bacterium]